MKFKQLKLKIRQCCEVIEASSVLGARPLFYLFYERPQVITIKGVEFCYYQSTKLEQTMRANGSFVSTILKDKTIVCDSIYDKLSEKSKEFIIMHEIGHSIYGDDFNKNPTKHAKRTLNEEIKCDSFAFSVINANEEDICSIYDELSELVPIGAKEVKKRRKQMMKCIKYGLLDDLYRDVTNNKMDLMNNLQQYLY